MNWETLVLTLITSALSATIISVVGNVIVESMRRGKTQAEANNIRAETEEKRARVAKQQMETDIRLGDEQDEKISQLREELDKQGCRISLMDIHINDLVMLVSQLLECIQAGKPATGIDFSILNRVRWQQRLATMEKMSEEQGVK